MRTHPFASVSASTPSTSTTNATLPIVPGFSGSSTQLSTTPPSGPSAASGARPTLLGQSSPTICTLRTPSTTTAPTTHGM